MKLSAKLTKILLALDLVKEVKEIRFLQKQYAMLIHATPSQPGLLHAKERKLVEVKEQMKIIDNILEQIDKLEK